MVRLTTSLLLTKLRLVAVTMAMGVATAAKVKIARRTSLNGGGASLKEEKAVAETEAGLDQRRVRKAIKLISNKAIARLIISAVKGRLATKSDTPPHKPVAGVSMFGGGIDESRTEMLISCSVFILIPP
jgi:hypothetical protein